MANPAQTGSQFPGSQAGPRGGGGSVMPPPTSNSPIQLSAGQANTQPSGSPSDKQPTGPGQEPSSGWRWLTRTVVLAAPVIFGVIYYLSNRSKEEPLQETPPSPPAKAIKANALPLNDYTVQTSPLTPSQYADISNWTNSAPVAPRPGEMFGNTPNTEQWLDDASRLNSLLVNKIRSLIEALGKSSSNASGESDKVSALRPSHRLAFEITDTAKWVGSGGYSSTVFFREVSSELAKPENHAYDRPAPHGLLYMKPLANPDWPQRWPEYLIARLESLVQLHKALLIEETKR